MSSVRAKPLPRTLRIETEEGPRDVDIYSEEGFRFLADLWTRSNWYHKLSYEVTWLGVPVIQLPEDLFMMQEVIYKTRPDVLVETGTAHGGTALFYASMLELLGRGEVVSIDVEIRKYNRLAIQAHPMSKRITLIEGSALDEKVARQVRSRIARDHKVLVALDSNHTTEHVRGELEWYAPLVTPGSYVVVFDTVMQVVGDAPGRSEEWAKNGPGPAIESFLADHPEFEVDPYYNRMQVTYCRGGYLKRK